MAEHASVPLTDFIEYPAEEMQQRSDDFYQAIKRRHSVRSFSGRSVDRAVIENCLRAAGTAPNGGNLWVSRLGF